MYSHHVHFFPLLIHSTILPLLFHFNMTQDESGNFRKPDNSRHTNVSKIIPPKHHDLLQLQSAMTIQYPHFKHHFMSSRLFQPSKNHYPDMPLKEGEEDDAKNTLLRAHRQMIRLRQMDTILHNAQRQGRISFYMTHHGEEAIHMGSASALTPQDVITEKQAC